MSRRTLPSFNLSLRYTVNVVGVKEDTRVGIQQAIWNYIKFENLQDKVDRKMIHADAKLKPVCFAPWPNDLS